MKAFAIAAAACAATLAVPAAAEVYTCRNEAGVVRQVEFDGGRLAMAVGTRIKPLCGGEAPACAKVPGGGFAFIDEENSETTSFFPAATRFEILDRLANFRMTFACVPADAAVRKLFG